MERTPLVKGWLMRGRSMGVWRGAVERAELLGSERPLAVDGIAQAIDHPADEHIADRCLAGVGGSHDMTARVDGVERTQGHEQHPVVAETHHLGGYGEVLAGRFNPADIAQRNLRTLAFDQQSGDLDHLAQALSRHRAVALGLDQVQTSAEGFKWLHGAARLSDSPGQGLVDFTD